MNQSQASTNSNLGFGIIAALIIFLSATFMALLWPFILQEARLQSDRLATEAIKQQGSEGQLDLQLAQWLNPRNQAAAAAVAEAQISAGESAKALTTIKRAGGAGDNLHLVSLSLKANLETANTAAAQMEANKLAQLSTSQADLRLCALAYGVVGDTATLAVLAPRLTAPEAAQAAIVAGTNKIALARELYSTGLLDSAQRLLLSESSSYERDYLLGQFTFEQNPSQPAQAEAYATAAVQANLTSQPARQLLVRILEAEHKTDAANQQKQLLHQLEVGQP